MRLPKKFFFILLLIVFISGAGCRKGAVSTFHIRQDVDFGFIKKVAVLPLDNLTTDRNAGDIVRQVVISEMLATGLVDVSTPGEVVAALDKAGIKSTSSLSAEQIKSIGNAIKVQAVIIGAVEKFGEIRAGNISTPEISITLMMADTNTGSILWSVTRTTGGASFMQRHFGARADTMSESLLKVVRAAVRTLYTY